MSQSILGRGWWRWLALLALSPAAAGAVECTEKNTLRADVAALDMPMVFNRLGAQNVNWQMYALWRDLVSDSGKPSPLPPIDEALAASRTVPTRLMPFRALAGRVTLRPDLRPRPLTLRVAAGQCLHVRFVNLFSAVSNPRDATAAAPFPGHPMDHRSHVDETVVDPVTGLTHRITANIDDQVASRVAGFHPQGLELVRSIADDSSHAGNNASSLAAPGQLREYWFHAPHEGAFLISNPGAVFGGEGTAGTAGTGLFGTVAVQPIGARFYRSQVTEEELRLATRPGGITPHGQPVIDYEAVFPPGSPWSDEGKAGMPILAMVRRGEIVHSDLNAIIVGPNRDGSFPPGTYPLESTERRNPTLPNRLEPFREFVSVFHDENAASQAFPGLFDHTTDQEENPLVHTLHGVRDAFMINYGSGGVGAEVVANRLRVGPMHDCVDCAFEEFFLSSFTVGDPALLVDMPANLGLEGVKPQPIGATDEEKQAMFGFPSDPAALQLPANSQGPKAGEAFYPHDPANVHHSYLGDFVKFRNVHVGKEQHIFHLHNHQWLYNPNDDNSNYIDAQAIGPGSGYTYEIAFGGSGNRNRSAGDAVFHCHYYPHFAQGMWYLWRIHDTFEAGSRLDVSGRDFHTRPYDLKSGRPAKGARALPDGEIVAGTPIPALVPLPGKALAPMPGEVQVVQNPRTSPLNGKPIGSLARVTKVADPTRPEIEWQPKANPGYPFWIAGIESTVGSRPPTPPLDMSPLPGSSDGGTDGGLPRHTVAGYSAHSESVDTFHRLSAEKKEKKVKPVYFPELGTGVEQAAMQFHAQAEHASSAVLPDGSVHGTVFRTNGAQPTPGAPFFDPCIDDRQRPLTKDRKPEFHNGVLDARPMVDRQQPGDPSGAPNYSFLGASPFDSLTPRVYKGANVQLDVTFNKLGDHFTQQRILALWEDVGPLLDRKKPPEPLVLRMNTFDCAVYLHTNLVPKTYELDDYQIATPTDIIGQHIHLPKWDLPSADGSANGWNYEDGTFSPAMVRARITAINAWNSAAPGFGEAPVPQPGGSTAPLAPTTHPFFNHARWGGGLQQAHCEKLWADQGETAFHTAAGGLGLPRQCDWLGARTTVQRWFSDPVIDSRARHRGLGITFTHDHLGPSTHQQVGLYATMLTEPPGSTWRHNETGELLYDTATRSDGGPTSWQAVITGPDGRLDFDRDGVEDSHREFFLQFGDFQHAYRKGEAFGVDAAGVRKPPTDQSFRTAINPSVRKPSNPNFPDIVAFEAKCPGSTGALTIPRPCPEVISADDIGMMVVNYRNEPVAARVYDPALVAAGPMGDLAYAYQSRTDRRLSVLNGIGGEDPSVAGSLPHYPVDVNAQRLPGDPYTPILRAYSGDMVRVKIQAGSHEHEHNGTIHGLKWLQAGSGFGSAPNSGWRNAQNAGLSEQFTLASSIVDYESPNLNSVDRLWAVDTSQDGLWNGTWGVIRTLQARDAARDELVALPQNPKPVLLSTRLDPARPSTNDCGPGTRGPMRVRDYRLLAVLANQALGNPMGSFIPPVKGLDPTGGTLTYNHRRTEVTLNVHDDAGVLLRTERYGVGPLHDPTAILLVREEDFDFKTGRVKGRAPVEPLVLRAAAGDCVRFTLRNLLPPASGRTPMPDLNGYTSLSHTVTRDAGSGTSSMTSFNNNLIRPSHYIGLHPQLVHYDVQAFDGSVVGINDDALVPPGGEKIYQWYAGGLEMLGYDVRQCRPEDNPGPVYEDLRQLRQRTVAGPDGRLRLLRPSTDLNSPAAIGQRLVALVDRLVPDQVGAERQSGPPPSGTQPERTERSEITPRARFISLPEATQALLARSFPGLDLQSLRFPRYAGADPAVPDRLLGEALGALFSSAAVRACLEVTPPDPNQVAIARRAERAAMPELDRLATEFVPDNAPLLPASEIFERLAVRGAAPGVTRIDVRSACAARLRGAVAEALQATLKDRAAAVAQPLSESFAYLVPQLDRDATPEDKRRAFAWWQPRYPALDKESTDIVRLSRTCRFEGIEFGGTNLSPPDRIKQGQKGAVGALVVLPERSVWAETFEDTAFNHQNPGVAQIGWRRTRATATVLHPYSDAAGARTLGGFRDLVMVHQKGLNLRYGKPQFKAGSTEFVGDPLGAVAVLSAEREAADQSPLRVAPEDAHDSGHMGINYGSEPLWFRFGIAPDAPFGHGGKAGPPPKLGVGLGGTRFALQAFSNRACCSPDTPSDTPTQPVGKPATPVFAAMAGGQSRVRMLMPTGVGRGSTSHLHGHVWRRDPYLASPTAGGPVASRCLGANPLAFWLGGQDSITPMAHFDWVLDRTGGSNAIRGDFLLRDQAGFGITNGLWGLVRSTPPRAGSLLASVLRQPLRDNCE